MKIKLGVRLLRLFHPGAERERMELRLDLVRSQAHAIDIRRSSEVIARTYALVPPVALENDHDRRERERREHERREHERRELERRGALL